MQTYFHAEDMTHKETIINILLSHSGLPGPRGNLSLIHEFSLKYSEFPHDSDHFEFLLSLWNTEANGEDKETILVLAGLLGLGHYALDSDTQVQVFALFKDAMNDKRWRVREIIQESLKCIAILDYPCFISLYESYTNPSLLEQRAFLTTTAHPEILKTALQKNLQSVS